jgi:hypothetical protein
MIKYFLKQVALAGFNYLFSAQIKTTGHLNIDQIVDDMVAQGTTVNKPDIISVLYLFHQTISKFLSMGYSIVTPVANFKPGIKGSFTGPEDRFDSSRHYLKVNVTAGKLVTDALSKVSVEKIEGSNQNPNITSLTDNKSKQKNEVLTPNGPAIIKGHRLDFNQDDEEQGIYLINGTKTTKVTEVVKQQPGEVIFMLPEKLPAGDYELELRKKSNGSKQLRSIRIKGLKTV